MQTDQAPFGTQLFDALLNEFLSTEVTDASANVVVSAVHRTVAR